MADEFVESPMMLSHHLRCSVPRGRVLHLWIPASFSDLRTLGECRDAAVFDAMWSFCCHGIR